MKTIRASILAFAGLALVACGVSDEEIQDALKNADPVESSLNFKVGEKWTAVKTVVRKGNVGNQLTGSDLQYKYEKGVSTPCEQGAASSSASNCGVVTAVILTETTTYSSVVTEKTDPAATETPGFVVAESATVKTEEQFLYPVTGTQSTANLPTVGFENSLYTLTELNNFIVRINEQNESDLGASETLVPSHPEGGRIYTDEDGMSWSFTTATTIALASRSVRALVGKVATSQTSGITLETLKAKCFRRDPAGGVSTTNSDINIHGDCTNQIQLVYDREIHVGLDLKLYETIKSVVINITGYGVRDNAGFLVNNNVANSLAGEFVFTYDAVESETTYKVSDVTF